MNKRYFVWALLASAMVMGSSEDVQAQRPAHYYPTRPTFSPYLFYRQFNGTGLPNYYTTVRPATTYYRDFLARQHAAPRELNRQAVFGERQVAEIVENQLRQRLTTGVGQPSVQARFLDTSHFYPPQRGRR